MRKVLVVGCILLFLGVCFQPAFANEISINSSVDVKEDCFECQPISRVDQLRVKLLLIRIEVFTNIILSKYGHIPEIEEKCQEIYDKITTYRERINDLTPDSVFNFEEVICIILIGLAGIGIISFQFLDDFLINYFPKYRDFILITVFAIFIPIMIMIWGLMFRFCDY